MNSVEYEVNINLFFISLNFATIYDNEIVEVNCETLCYIYNLRIRNRESSNYLIKKYHRPKGVISFNDVSFAKEKKSHRKKKTDSNSKSVRSAIQLTTYLLQFKVRIWKTKQLLDECKKGVICPCTSKATIWNVRISA